MRPPLLHSLEAPDGQPSVVPVRVSAFDGPEPVRVAPSLSSGFTRLVSVFCALSRPAVSSPSHDGTAGNHQDRGNSGA
jgi:hypothetical protein